LNDFFHHNIQPLQQPPGTVILVVGEAIKNFPSDLLSSLWQHTPVIACAPCTFGAQTKTLISD